MEHEFLYKYKSLSTGTDLSRLCDIIGRHRIYLPNYSKLNDPFEGAGITLKPSQGYAGCGMSEIYDTDYSIFSHWKGRYKVLSLSEIPDSPQLWAHYGGNYTGCSLILKKTGPFGNAKKVEYIKEKLGPIYIDDYDDSILEKDFFLKSYGWSYEKEWRIISKEKTEYLYFDKEDLFGLIVGFKINKKIYYFLDRYVHRIYKNDDFKIYRAWPGNQSYKIRFTRGNQFQLAGGEENTFVEIGD